MLNNLIFVDDLIELWIKLNQRGVKFIVSKLNFIGKARTLSSFDDQFEHANWWVIPYLRERRNCQITGDAGIDYETYVTNKYLDKGNASTMVSLGCGEGNHEMRFAELNPRLKVKGYDISKKLIDSANKKAINRELNNVAFIAEDVYAIHFENNSVDYFLFNASLHHFINIQSFIVDKIKPALKEGGLVIINEYVGPNRLNFSSEQIAHCNDCLRDISKANRKIFKLNKYKERCYRLGKMRMIISDPSECVDSESILQVLNNEFETIELKSLGGNILMPVLKHIAHHFAEGSNDELMELIQKEEAFLENHSPDYVFGIYKKID